MNRHEISFEFGTVDLYTLEEQKGYLIDTRELEDEQEYIDAYTGIIHLMDVIGDHGLKILNRISIVKPREKVIDNAVYEYWEEYPPYPICDWQYQIANNATRLGYWDWVESEREANE